MKVTYIKTTKLYTEATHNFLIQHEVVEKDNSVHKPNKRKFYVY